MAYEDFAVDPSGMGMGFGGASPLAVKPTSYAFPENYGNPKNKIYNLTAGPEDAIRLKGVDGTIFFEGKGPEAAAKAAEIVQQLGKEFGTQSTWILDKQPAGGDWKQVSQDTVGQKKTTAVNSFLNVALPLVGGFFGGVPGAMLASVGNSALQNKNSAQAWKDAAVAGISTYIGGKLGPVVGKAAQTVAPGLTNAVAGTVGKFIPGTATQGFAGEGVGELIGGISRYGTSAAAGLGSAAGAGAGALLGTRIGDAVKANLDNEIVVRGAKAKPVDINPALGVAVAGGINGAEITNPDFNPEIDTDPTKTKAEQLADWIKAHPLEAASLGLTLAGGIGGAASGNSGSGSGSNTLSYAPGKQPGTLGSLSDVFRAKLPKAPASFSVTPRDMGQRDWLRYGMGPEASFFSNVPDRQANLAVNPTPTPTPAPTPAPAPTATTAPASNEYTEAQWAALEKSDRAAYADAIRSGKHGYRMMVAKGGSIGHGTSHKPRTEFAVHGAGTGRSDDIPAVLSDGEYVMDAETVALLGDGSSKAGAEKLDQLRVNLRRHKGANLAKGRFSVNAKSPEKYLAGGRV